ncbi:hypothetical protein M3C58_05875 [Brachybacterium muris]|uniref:hypothetical protein n=1 Tax=Brachybacterium muris TaxID=219301 RepID=UPI0012375977|nr:hypothetical protein [Brachybacterium muris]MBM7499856.1 hypothetical protein [Brachybacterium muris]MCT1653836.1 hypothetical protein [Brachybacterium muris]MCT1997729.1 hypothetical protein [Brachybacterium muris]MCT2297162.1 hypothetical protein [Brachybacterium muris]
MNLSDFELIFLWLLAFLAVAYIALLFLPRSNYLNPVEQAFRAWSGRKGEPASRVRNALLIAFVEVVLMYQVFLRMFDEDGRWRPAAGWRSIKSTFNEKDLLVSVLIVLTVLWLASLQISKPEEESIAVREPSTQQKKRSRRSGVFNPRTFVLAGLAIIQYTVLRAGLLVCI